MSAMTSLARHHGVQPGLQALASLAQPAVRKVTSWPHSGQVTVRASPTSGGQASIVAWAAQDSSAQADRLLALLMNGLRHRGGRR